MSFTPEEIAATTFPVVRRGYAPDQVDGYLRRLAEHLRESDEFRTAGDEVATALRGLHGLLSGMKEESEQEAATIRAEAEVEAERRRREAEAYAEQLEREAKAEAERIRRQVDEELSRKRTDADREIRSLLAEAEADTTRLLELAKAEMLAAEREADAVQQTVRVQREEVDGYVLSVSQRAEHAARERVARVLEQHQAELDRLIRSRHEVASDLERLQSLLRSTLDETGRYVDLTRPAVDQNGPRSEGERSGENELARSIVNEVLSERPPPPSPF
jgi:DivIVA domain-containing protein